MKLAEMSLSQGKFPDTAFKLTENLPGIIYRLHLEQNNRLQFFNNSASLVTGYAEDELPTGELCPLIPLIVEEDRSRVKKELLRAVTECIPFSVQYRLRHKDGRIHYLLEQGNPVRGEDGNVIYIDGLINDITVFKELQNQFNESESRFRQLTEHIHEVFWLCNGNLSRVLYVSPAYEEIWGRSCQSLYENPRSFRDTVHPDDREDNLHHILNNPAKGYDKEYRIIRPDGSVRWVRDRAYPIPDESGEVYRIAGIATDITSKKESERLLKEHSQIIDQIHDSVVTTDLDGYITSWNRGAEKMFGYSAGEAIGKHVSFLYAKEQYGLLENDIIAPLKEKGDHSIEIPLYNKSGRNFYVHLSLSLIKDAAGRSTRMIGYCMDIDERKKAELELNSQTEKLISILESISDGFLSIDNQWNFTYLNSQAEKLLGRRAIELLNHSLAEAFPEITGTAFYAEYQKALSQKKAANFVEYYAPADKWLEVHAYPFPKGFSMYFQDVTERILYERELRARADRQKIITNLGLSALSGKNLSNFLKEAIEILAKTLDIEFAKILELQPDNKSMLLREGTGWKEGYVHQARVENSIKSQAGYTLKTNKPVVVEDFTSETRFKIPLLLKQHGIRSGISTIIYSKQRPFGVLGVHSEKPRQYTDSEIDFVQAIANTIALAISNHEANMALQASEQRFRSIFENAAAGMATVDIREKFLQVNPKLCEFLGYREEELFDLTIEDITHPDDVAATSRRFTQVAEGGQAVFDLVCRYICKNGNIVWGHTTTAWVFDYQSKPLYCIKLIQDITPLKEAERALRESEERFRTIVETAPSLILISDSKGKNIYVSPNCKEITGYSRKEFLGKIKWWVHADDDERARKLFEQSLGNGMGYKNFEYKAVKKNGTVWHASSSWNSIKNENGEVQGVVLETVDITERKQAEEQLKKSREQLRLLSIHLQSVRENEQERVSRKIHDEIGQQLVGLQMNLSWLLEKISPAEKILKEKVKYLQERTEEAIDVVEKISGELRPRILDVLGLKEAIRWHLQEVREATGIQSVCKFVPENMTLDPAYSNVIYLLFRESLSNVVRHSKAANVKIYLKKGESILHCRIEDNGIGVTTEQIERPDSFGIMGMRERVINLKGLISISGTPGRGTKIQIKLPLKNSGAIQ